MIAPSNSSKCCHGCPQQDSSYIYQPVSIATELFGLMAIHKPVGHIAGAAILGMSAYTSSDRISIIVMTAGAVAMLVKPIFVMTASNAFLSATYLYKGGKELYAGQREQAAKDLFHSGRYFLGLAAVMTGSAQLVTVTLVVHTVFSLNRSYEFYTNNRPVEAVITFVIAAAGARGVYQRSQVIKDLFFKKETSNEHDHITPTQSHAVHHHSGCCSSQNNYFQISATSQKKEKKRDV